MSGEQLIMNGLNADDEVIDIPMAVEPLGDGRFIFSKLDDSFGNHPSVDLFPNTFSKTAVANASLLTEAGAAGTNFIQVQLMNGSAPVYIAASLDEGTTFSPVPMEGVLANPDRINQNEMGFYRFNKAEVIAVMSFSGGLSTGRIVRSNF